MRKSIQRVLPKDPSTLYNELNAAFNTPQHSKRFNKGEKEILFPAGKTETHYEDIDITLAFKLYEQCYVVGYAYQGNIFLPRTGLKFDLDNLPSLATANYADGIQLLKDLRNSVFHKTSICEAEFKKLWPFLVKLLDVLGYNTAQIVGLEKGSLDDDAMVQLAKFKSIITNYEAQVKNLEQKMNTLDNTSAQYRQDLILVQTDLKSVQNQLTQQSNKIFQSEQANVENLGKLQKSINDLSQNIAIEMKNQSDKLDTLQTDMKNQDGRVDALKHEVKKQNEKQNILEERVDNQDGNIQVISDEVTKQGEIMKNVQDKVKGQDEKLETIRNDLSSLKSKEEEKEKAFVSIKSEISVLEKKFEALGGSPDSGTVKPLKTDIP